MAPLHRESLDCNSRNRCRAHTLTEREDRFVWPSGSDATVSLTGRELNALLDGFDVFARAHGEMAVRRVG